MEFSIAEFLFGEGASAWNTAFGIIGGILASILFGWGILKGVAGFLSRKRVLSPTRGDTPKLEGSKDSGPPVKHYINVPTGRPVVGRATELAQLAEMLAETGEEQVNNSGAILSGQGGIGKTTLARAFAEQNAQDYAGVLWVNAATRQGVIDGLANLCGPLGLEVPVAPVEGHAQQVLAALAASGERWLIIYDNVENRDDMRGLVPRGSHLIATTRQGEGWPGFGALGAEVLGFDIEDGAAVKLLMAEAGRGDDASGARDLAEKLGGLPLALVMAGGLIRKEGLGFGEYLDQVARIIAREPKNGDYPDSVIGAVRLSYEKLDDDAKLVADLFAWWAPEGLEPRLITDAPSGAHWGGYKKDVPEVVQDLAQSPERVAAAVEALEERSILRRGAVGFELHRMSAAALRAMQGEAPLSGAAALLAAVYPGGEKSPAFSPQWPACRRLTPHLRSLWASGAAPESAAMDFLLNQASIFLGKTGDVSGCAETARASLLLMEARLPEEDREIAVGYANLGAALKRAGDLDGAEAALRRAVALDAAHRPGTVDLAESHDLLGGVLLEKGRGGDSAALIAALREYQRSAAILRRHVPRQSDGRAQVLNNLGAVRDALRQGAAALRLYEYSLAIQRQVLPEGDARLGYGLMNVGAMALTQGAADRAEGLLQEALALRQAVYLEAPRHEEIVNAAGWLVSTYLVRAVAGENRGMREMKARQLCEAFGFEFDAAVEMAKQFSYAPGG